MITVQTKHQPVELTPHGQGYIYRGFRLAPNYTSPSTGRPINSPKGWTCPDFREEGMSRCAWYPSLARFAEDVDFCYTLAAEGKARHDRKAALLRAAENLNPHEAAQVRALVAECNRKQAAAAAERQAIQAALELQREAQRRLHADAPELLAALSWALAQLEDSLDPDHQQALEAAQALVARHQGA